MANELYDAVKQVQTIVGAITGVRFAPEDPPEMPNVFPFAVSYLSNDLIISEPGVTHHDATLVCEVHVTRANLPVDVQTLMPFADSIPNALVADPTLGSKVTTLKQIRTLFGPLGYGDVKTLGFKFSIDVKIDVLT